MRILLAAFLLFLLLHVIIMNRLKKIRWQKLIQSRQKRRQSPNRVTSINLPTQLEKKVTAVLLKFPFVQKSNKYIDSMSNHKHGISFMLDNTKGENVSVLAGYNSDERFETYYHFYVDPKTMAVTIYDPLTNKTLPVKDYIKTLK